MNPCSIIGESILVLFLLTFFLPICNAANILFYFKFSTYSHRITAWPLVEALAEKGHSVTFLQSFENKNKNPKVKEVVGNKTVIMPDFVKNRRVEGPLMSAINHAYRLPMVSASFCNEFLNDPNMISWVNSSTFDLIVIDALYNNCALGLAYKWKAKTVLFGTSSVLEYWPDTFGFPAESSWISSLHFGYGQDLPLKFFNRILSTLSHLYFRYSMIQHHYEEIMPNLREKLGMPEMPSLLELESNISLVLMNAHFSEELARSLPPMIIPVGGMHCSEKTKPLPQEMEKFINQGNNGFIYISLGSTAKISNLPIKVQNAFFNSLKSSDIEFLWKWEEPRPKEMPSNVYVSKWMPQQDILAHPKIRGFITHGGLLSIQEAIFHGVPMISFPIFAEQDYNAERLVRTKRGISLEITSFTQEELTEAIDRILTDDTYSKSIKQASVYFKDRPQNPVDTAVWWVEYVLRHEDTSSLRPLGISQTWYERRLLDVWGFLFLMAFLILYINIFILRKVFSYLSNLLVGHKDTTFKVKIN